MITYSTGKEVVSNWTVYYTGIGVYVYVYV